MPRSNYFICFSEVKYKHLYMIGEISNKEIFI